VSALGLCESTAPIANLRLVAALGLRDRKSGFPLHALGGRLAAPRQIQRIQAVGSCPGGEPNEVGRDPNVPDAGMRRPHGSLLRIALVEARLTPRIARADVVVESEFLGMSRTFGKMWRFVLLAVVVLLALTAAPAGSAAVESVTLVVTPTSAVYGSPIALSGQVAPAAAGEIVELSVLAGETWEPVGMAVTEPDGTFRHELAALSPGPYKATSGGVESTPMSLTIEPALSLGLRGQRLIGSTLRVSGRLQPAEAGTLVAVVDGVRRRVHPSANGSFSLSVVARSPGRLVITVRLEPAAGYAAAARSLRPRIAAPALRLGSRGPAVLFLERRLAQLRYALLRVDNRFGPDTADAILAFRKVRGLARVGSVDRALWRALLNARPPQPRVRRGDHIEVDKTRQVLFEVRNGRVVRAVHVSTGATGNTPLGTWRVYWKDPGYNSLGMYYSLYFLRGFAIHGYNPVPVYPASHGCVRLPIWFARGFFDRWPLGARIRIFP
jgi:hypothetical protein